MENENGNNGHRKGTMVRPQDIRNENRVTEHLQLWSEEFYGLDVFDCPYRYVFDKVFCFPHHPGKISKLLEIKTWNNEAERYANIYVELNKYERALEFKKYGIESWIAQCARDFLYFRRLDTLLEDEDYPVRFIEGNPTKRGQHGNLIFNIPRTRWEKVSVPPEMEWGENIFFKEGAKNVKG